MTLDMLIFKKEQLDDIAKELGMEFVEGILFKDDKKVNCHYCHSEITKDNLANILPGSEIVCCDDIMCFLDYAIERELEVKTT